MATTDAQVCNMALGLVGQRQLIDELTEQSDEAQACNTYFEETCKQVLQRYDWRSARKRAVLAATTQTRDGWAFCYAAPADMLLPRRIWNGRLTYGAGQQIPFEWELNDAADGFLILTNQQDAQLVYTVRTKPALWTPMLTAAVVARLGVFLATMLPVKPELAAGLEQRAELALQRGAASEFNAATQAEPVDAEWIRER